MYPIFLQATLVIGSFLHEMNTQQAIDEGAGFYSEFLRYGKGEAQPDVALNAAWGQRNLAICARLLQALQLGDRAVVFYGQGHVYQLRNCIGVAPEVERVDANVFLPVEMR